MVGSVKGANVPCIFFFFTDFPVLSTPQKRTPCMHTPVALTTLPAPWPAGYHWKQPPSWRKQRPVWQLWQWMWKMARPLLFWETAEGDCTRYDLDATGSKEDKTNQRCSGARGKKGNFSCPLGSQVPTKDHYYQIVSSHTVLAVENVNASNSGHVVFGYIFTESASGLVHPAWLPLVLLGMCFMWLKSLHWDFGGGLKSLHTSVVPTCSWCRIGTPNSCCDALPACNCDSLAGVLRSNGRCTYIRVFSYPVK